MKKRFVIVLGALLIISLLIIFANRKYSNNTTNKNNNIKERIDNNIVKSFTMSDNFYNDINSQLDKMNDSISYKNKYYKINEEDFTINTMIIKCHVQLKEDKYEAMLPAWIIRYTNIDDQYITLKGNYENTEYIYLKLNDINVSNKNCVVGNYEFLTEEILETQRMDFVNLYLKECDKE